VRSRPKNGFERVKILVCGINFAPELTGVGKYTGEMTEWLAERGHDVRVVAAPPFYPEWRVGEGYRAGRYMRERWRGVDVCRCPVWAPAKPSALRRLLHLASFALSSLPVMLAQVAWRPDAVWVVEPTLLCAPSALLVAWLTGAKSWLHVQDLEVDAAFELGLLRGKGVRRVIAACERWLMRRFDRVSTISRRMLERTREKGVDPEHLVFFPNWIDVDAFSLFEAEQSMRAEMGIAPKKVVALYSGSMGKKQGLTVMAAAAALLRGDANLVFVFCGNGPGREDLVVACEGLENVRFLELQPVERLTSLLLMADIHLLPQRAAVADLVMPSKLTGMLASGRPVVATCGEGTEVARVVETCGLVTPPDDAVALAEAVQTLANDGPLRACLGSRARTYAQAHLAREAVLGRFEEAVRGSFAMLVE
jgi:colanic acid biosynthesis glycosyl transferase WcaI